MVIRIGGIVMRRHRRRDYSPMFIVGAAIALVGAITIITVLRVQLIMLLIGIILLAAGLFITQIK